jgi:signal peptidase I
MEEKKRNPRVAAIFSLLNPGLGIVYNGNLKNGLIVTASYELLALIMSAAGAFRSFTVALVVVAVDFVAWLFFIVYVASQARNIKTIRLRAFNRWFVYLAFIIFSILGTYFSRYLSPAKNFKVPTGSMSPAIDDGDCLVADMHYYRNHEIKIGDVIAYHVPQEPGVTYMKRCIALEGQTVEIRDGVVYVNGTESLPSLLLKRDFAEIMPRSYNDPRVYPKGAGNQDQYGPVTIPKGKLFVLGDHRDNSLDSRYYGFVDRNDVTGKALYIYWSNDFSKLGRMIQ